MRVLVIGGCGFIGSHIVDELIIAGHDISVVDHSEEKFRPPVHGVTYYYEDILSIANIKEAIKKADVVLHTVSSTNPASSNTDPQADIQTNLLGMVQLLECMRELNKKRIIFLSSGGTVYGKPEILPIPENHTLNPQCSYAVVKIAMEQYLNVFSNLYGFQTTVIRPSNPYGPRQWYEGAQGVIANFTANALQNEALTLWGTGLDIRDFFHVKDLAKLCVQFVECGQPGLFNAGSGQGHTIREIIDTLETIHGSALHINQLEKRDFDIPKVVLDIQKVQTCLNWSPEILLYDGMSDYYRWLHNTLSINRSQLLS